MRSCFTHTVFNVLLLNTALANRVSGGSDWTDHQLEEMGDDLGDEWWKQEGKSGILLNKLICRFCVYEPCDSGFEVSW